MKKQGGVFLILEDGSANIQLELHTKITQKEFDAFGEDFNTTKHGFLDFLLLDERGHALIVLEAKSEDLPPLSAKEQARRYAKSQNCRFIILSNGNLHYFWDLERGNPYVITQFPKPWSVKGYQTTKPNPEKLINETVNDEYIALNSIPHLQGRGWLEERAGTTCLY